MLKRWLKERFPAIEPMEMAEAKLKNVISEISFLSITLVRVKRITKDNNDLMIISITPNQFPLFYNIISTIDKNIVKRLFFSKAK